MKKFTNHKQVIRYLIKKANSSPTQIQTCTGFTRSQIYRWINGTATPRYDSIVTVSNWLGYQVEKEKGEIILYDKDLKKKHTDREDQLYLINIQKKHISLLEDKVRILEEKLAHKTRNAKVA